MYGKITLGLAMRFVAWGWVHRAENNLIESCLVTLAVGLGALYALAARSLPAGLACLLVLGMATWSLYLHGEAKGPPDGDSSAE